MSDAITATAPDPAMVERFKSAATAARQKMVNAAALANCGKVLGVSAEIQQVLDVEVQRFMEEESRVLDEQHKAGAGGTTRIGPYPKPPEHLVKVLCGMGGADRATVTLEWRDSRTGEYNSQQTHVAERPQNDLWDFRFAVDPEFTKKEASNG